MSQQAGYFFINHTRKEYCGFDNTDSIITSIEVAVYKNVTWESTDDIRVEFQDTEDSTGIWQKMGEEGYLNLDEPLASETSDDSEDDCMMGFSKLNIT